MICCTAGAAASVQEMLIQPGQIGRDQVGFRDN